MPENRFPFRMSLARYGFSHPRRVVPVKIAVPPIRQLKLKEQSHSILDEPQLHHSGRHTWRTGLLKVWHIHATRAFPFLRPRLRTPYALPPAARACTIRYGSKLDSQSAQRRDRRRGNPACSLLDPGSNGERIVRFMFSYVNAVGLSCI